jgi:hypothetical protein
MKQAKPPVVNSKTETGKTTAPAGSRAGRKKRATESNPVEPARLTWPMVAVIGLILAGLVGLTILLSLQPGQKIERSDMEGAVATALVNTGLTPPPTFVPGSEFGVDFVIFGIKDYVPVIPNEKINFMIINKRQKSLFISNCDGVILQRFLGTDSTDKKQTDNFDNWRSVAPGGFPYCGPASGREARQIAPGVTADASFKFDTKSTRPFSGENWNIPGTYRLFIQYYLTCPNNTLKVAECIDKGVAESDYFKIVAPTYVSPNATSSAGPTAPAPSPTSKP